MLKVWLRCQRCFSSITLHERTSEGGYRCQRCGCESHGRTPPEGGVMGRGDEKAGTRNLSLWEYDYGCIWCGRDIVESALHEPGNLLRPAEYLGDGMWLCGGVGGCAEQYRREGTKRHEGQV